MPVSVIKRIAKRGADPEQGFQLGLQGSQRLTVSADLVAGTISGRTCCQVGGGCWEDVCAQTSGADRRGRGGENLTSLPGPHCLLTVKGRLREGVQATGFTGVQAAVFGSPGHKAACSRRSTHFSPAWVLGTLGHHSSGEQRARAEESRCQALDVIPNENWGREPTFGGHG